MAMRELSSDLACWRRSRPLDRAERSAPATGRRRAGQGKAHVIPEHARAVLLAALKPCHRIFQTVLQLGGQDSYVRLSEEASVIPGNLPKLHAAGRQPGPNLLWLGLL